MSYSIYKDIKRETPKTTTLFVRTKEIKYKKPIGVIGSTNFKANYGFDGRTYYVTCGFYESKLTTIELEFNEAKALYDAFCFCDFPTLPYSCKGITAAVKKARKDYRLHLNTTETEQNNKMFWYFVDYFNSLV